MWAILRDPCHLETFLDLGESFAPMRGLVEHLIQRSYAGDVFAFTSLDCFVLTSAPSYMETEGHDRIAIDFDPVGGLFTVRYCEWVSPARNSSHSEAACRTCERPEVLEVIDLYVLRLILLRRSG
jgi:hypothetical protein